MADMWKPTWQAAILSAISNLLAQALDAYQKAKPFKLNITPLVQFVLYTALQTPPNVIWQQYLEDSFPGYVQSTPKDPKAEKKKVENRPQLSIKNTLAKFLIDQTIGALGNTILFIVIMGAIQGASTDVLIERVKQRTIPMIIDGYKFWPLISIMNFAVVPVEQRIVVGGTAGVLWGIYLSLSA